MCKIRHLKLLGEDCAPRLSHDSRGSLLLQMFCVIREKISQVGDGEHGSL